MKAVSSVLILLAIGFFACKKKCNEGEYYPATQQIYFELKVGGQRLSDSALRGIRLYIDEKDGLTNTDGNFGVEYAANGIKSSGETTYDSSRPILVGYLIIHVTHQRFHFEYPDKTVDTFFIERKITEEAGDHCKVNRNEIKSISYKGYKLGLDSSLMNQYFYHPVYIINK